MLIDVHCHLDFPQFDRDREDVIKRAMNDEIIMINSGIGPDSIRNTLKLSKQYENIFATFGLSPYELNEDMVDETIKLIKRNRNEILAIGEVGLDYYWIKNRKEREKERENFERFISLADELNLPLIIHSRDAERDVINILEKEDIPVILHCFGGSIKDAEKAVSLGYLISIPTSIIHSRHKQMIAEKIPIESIVLETDAPYLSPRKGVRNEPLNIKMSVKKIAEIKALTTEMVEIITTENAKDFFNLEI